MKETILGIVKTIIDTGRTKLIAYAISTGGLFCLAYLDKLKSEWAAAGMVVLTVGYFIFRHLERINETKEKL